MRKILFMTFGLLFVLYTRAFASYYVCGHAVVSAAQPSLGYYAPSLDPSKVPPCQPPYILTPLPDDETVIAQQDTLYNTIPNKRHIKVVDGRMVEMTQAEKDAVDLPGNQQKAANEAARNEMKVNPVCANNTLPEIDAYWKGPGSKQAALQASMTTFQTSINAMTAGTAKTAMQNAYNAMLLVMNQFIDDSNLSWRSVCSHQYVQP